MLLTTPSNTLNNFSSSDIFCRTATTHSASFDWDQESDEHEVTALISTPADDQARDLPAIAP